MVTLLNLCLYVLLAAALSETAENSFVYMTGRHVCGRTRTNIRSYPMQKTFCALRFITVLRPCLNVERPKRDGLCTGHRRTYTTIRRTIYKQTKESKIEFSCCPGWERETVKKGCTKPSCKNDCNKNGVCSRPNICKCSPGWKGVDCSVDVNECHTNNGRCQHQCINLKGTFKCRCNEGYVIGEDGKTCKMCLTCNPEWKDMNLRMRALEQITLKLTEENQKLKEEIKVPKTLPQMSPHKSPPIIRPFGAFSDDTGNSEKTISTLDVFATLVEKVAMLEARLDNCSCASGGDSLSNLLFRDQPNTMKNNKKT